VFSGRSAPAVARLCNIPATRRDAAVGSIPWLYHEDKRDGHSVSQKLTAEVRGRQVKASYFSSGVALKGASQRGHEPLDTEVEDASQLEAATKQRD
jgi:hypothetical protein